LWHTTLGNQLSML